MPATGADGGGVDKIGRLIVLSVTPLEASNDDGDITWRVTYRTWGNVVTEEVTADYAPKLRFQGQYFDAETGLHYNRFRYYDPGAGKFVSQDPIGLLGGMNLSNY